VPSIGLRPNVVYGVARDQGMSSKNTAAIQAAALDQAFHIPFSGPYNWLYAGEAAAAFIASASEDITGAHIFDLNGLCEDVEDGLEILTRLNAEAEITSSGDPFPFPPDMDESALRAHVIDYPVISQEVGIEATYRAFRQLRSEGRLPALPN